MFDTFIILSFHQNFISFNEMKFSRSFRRQTKAEPEFPEKIRDKHKKLEDIFLLLLVFDG